MHEFLQSEFGNKRFYSEVEGSNWLLRHGALGFCRTVAVLCKNADCAGRLRRLL